MVFCGACFDSVWALDVPGLMGVAPLLALYLVAAIVFAVVRRVRKDEFRFSRTPQIIAAGLAVAASFALGGSGIAPLMVAGSIVAGAAVHRAIKHRTLDSPSLTENAAVVTGGVFIIGALLSLAVGQSKTNDSAYVAAFMQNMTPGSEKAFERLLGREDLFPAMADRIGASVTSRELAMWAVLCERAKAPSCVDPLVARLGDRSANRDAGLAVALWALNAIDPARAEPIIAREFADGREMSCMLGTAASLALARAPPMDTSSLCGRRQALGEDCSIGMWRVDVPMPLETLRAAAKAELDRRCDAANDAQ